MIPSEIGSLESHSILDLQKNMMTGPLPTELGNLKQLIYAFMRTSAIQGILPSEMGNIIKMNSFNISNS